MFLIVATITHYVQNSKQSHVNCAHPFPNSTTYIYFHSSIRTFPYIYIYIYIYTSSATDRELSRMAAHLSLFLFPSLSLSLSLGLRVTQRELAPAYVMRRNAFVFDRATWDVAPRSSIVSLRSSRSRRN